MLVVKCHGHQVGGHEGEAVPYERVHLWTTVVEWGKAAGAGGEGIETLCHVSLHAASPFG